MRLSAGAYVIVWMTPFWSSVCPSMRAAIVWLKTKELNAKRPPGRNDRATRSKTARFSCQPCRWSSERNGT